MSFVSKNWKGILVCFCIAVPSWLLGQRFPIIGGPVIAILAGMVLTLGIRDKSALESGIKYTSKKILQYAVILLGFGLNLQVILQTGKQSLPIILSTIATSLIIAYVLHRAMRIPGKISTLVGVGSSICGGSAIAATAPVIDADDEEVAQAISVIFFFNVLAAILFPTLGGFIGCIGDTTQVDPKLFEVDSAVDKVMHVQEPYKLANRAFHPEDSVIDVSGVKIGGGHLGLIAGPCSVESVDQVMEIAKAVKASGANLLRGGAFKPRTSPYSFQGLGLKGLDIL